jgi:rhamnulose-1-phosphate aldolase
MSALIEQSWCVKAMVKATADMWLKGWDERNGGNVSLRLLAEDIANFRHSLMEDRVIGLGETVAELSGQYFLVTGSVCSQCPKRWLSKSGFHKAA